MTHQQIQRIIQDEIGTDKIIAAVEYSNSSLSNPGFCLSCKTEIEGVEPDACGYVCEECGKATVYGAQELLFYVL